MTALYDRLQMWYNRRVKCCVAQVVYMAARPALVWRLSKFSAAASGIVRCRSPYGGDVRFPAEGAESCGAVQWTYSVWNAAESFLRQRRRFASAVWETRRAAGLACEKGSET